MSARSSAARGVSRLRRGGPVVLLTGFEPFDGHGLNPSGEIAKRLDGRRIGGARIVGRVLPVVMEGLARQIADWIAGLRPAAVIGLGLAAGETVIRLERQAVNRVDFRIPDNAGVQLEDRPIDPGGPPFRPTRLPVERIQRALVAKGIPARLSDSAGLYLCNVAMYEILARVAPDVPSGFIHLPHLRAEAARRLAEEPSPAEPAKFASMEFPTLRRAVEIIIGQTVGAPASNRRRRRAPKA